MSARAIINTRATVLYGGTVKERLTLDSNFGYKGCLVLDATQSGTIQSTWGVQSASKGH